MPISTAIKSLYDLVNKEDIRDRSSFEQYIKFKYGDHLYQTFFKPYTEKFLRIPAENIHSDWATTGINRTVIDKKVKADIKKGIEPISIDEFNKIKIIKNSNTKVSSIINACSDWVIDNHKDFARLPNDNEWQRFLKSPLNGKIGLSFALQWRYNFGTLFSSLPLIK